jgi:hypothetical protein
LGRDELALRRAVAEAGEYLVKCCLMDTDGQISLLIKCRQQQTFLPYSALAQADLSIGCGCEIVHYAESRVDLLGFLASALAFGWRQWRWYLLDKPK